MVEDVYVGAKGETFASCYYAEGFRVEGSRTANGLFEEAREEDFCVGGAIGIRLGMLSFKYMFHSFGTREDCDEGE